MKIRAGGIQWIQAVLAAWGVMFFAAPQASAQPVLSVTPITWNVIGLDSNNVNTGPDTFPVGVRICNTGTATATNVTATYVPTGTINALINLQGLNVINLGSIVSGPAPPSQYTISSTPSNCADAYFNVRITRNAAAYDTVQGYRIDVTADGLGTISTPTPRELYVKKLVSQNRNDILGFTGPTTVYVGGTYQYALVAGTATNGYEQLSNFPNFPNVIFQIVDTSVTYSAPAGGINSTVYADACGWDNVIGPSPPGGTYLSCIGPNHYTGGKAGGDLTSLYTVRILSAGTATVENMVYDFSGASYHYNSDFGDPIESLSIISLYPTLTMTKSSQVFSDPFNNQTNPKAIPGSFVNYTLTAANPTTGVPDADTVIITDPVPANTDLFVGDIGGAGSGPVAFTDGAPSSGLTYTFTALNDMTDDVSFSSDGGATYTYTPTPNGIGVDPAVTHIRINPKGSFGPNSSFTAVFRVSPE